MHSVGIDLKELGGGSAAEMFEILLRDWSLWPIFTPQWASVDMNWGGSTPLQPPDNSNPGYAMIFDDHAVEVVPMSAA